MESEIASFSKFAAVWYRGASSLEITVRKLLCSVVIKTFLFDMYFNWKPKRPILSSFDCERVRLRIHVNSFDPFEPKPGKIFRSCKDLDLDLTLQICSNICVCHGVQLGHDEGIILSLPCDPSARRT